MFNYSEVAKRLRKPTRAEQNCLGCKKWVEIPIELVKKILKDLDRDGMADFTQMECPECRKVIHVLIPGKYDNPLAPRSECNQQFYEWADAPKRKHRRRALSLLEAAEETIKDLESRFDGEEHGALDTLRAAVKRERR